MLKINIDTKNLDTDYRVDKATKAAFGLKKVMNSKQFKSAMLEMPRFWRNGEKSFFKNLSNEEIYNYIMSGKEEWNGIADKEIDLVVHDYTSSWENRFVIGYMNPFKAPIWVNTRHFDSASLKKVASNFAHEYGHTLGMRHSGPDFRKSIPYYLNQVIENLWDDIYSKNPKVKYVRKCRRLWYTLWIKKRCKLVIA